MRVGRGEAIETADNHDVEGVQPGIAERDSTAGLCSDGARSEAEGRDLKPWVGFECPPQERRRPGRPGS